MTGHMKWFNRQSALLLAAFLAASTAASATTCIDLPPMKPVRRICGVVFVSTGDRINAAEVTVLQAGKEVVTQKTMADGKFAFDHLEAGKYEIRVRTPLSTRVAFGAVVLENPTAKTKREIAVHIGLEGCHSFRLVRSKKFESTLNSSDPS